MQNSNSSRATMVIVLGLVVALAGRLMGLSLVTIFLLLAGVMIISWIVTYWRTWRTLDWFRAYNAYSARVREGQTDEVIAELTARREAGDHSPETAFTLAAAYNYIGDGQAAEPLALEAFDTVTAGDTCNRTDLSSRAKCDIAYLTRFDMMLNQGRFMDAASSVRGRMKQALQPNFMTALTAWAYYLGRDGESSRALLEEIKEPGSRLQNERLLTPRFELVVAYLRHKLNGADTLAKLREHAAMIDAWDKTVERNAHNPYGQRLAEVLADMRAVINTHEI